MAKQIFSLALISAVGQAVDGKCRALALSGGGTNGAWEAGVVWGLTHYGNPEDFFWEVHSGVSAGSINTIGLIGWTPQDTVASTQYLSDMWASVDNSDVYQLWEGQGVVGLVESCLQNISCVDTAPALAWLQGQLSTFEGIKRNFTVNAVDVSNGDYVSFTQDNTAFEDVPQAALSSSSIPGFFPPQHFHGRTLMDGGTVWNLDATSPIKQCLEMGYAEKDIIIDIAVCGDESLNEEEELGKNSFYEFFRGHNIHSHYTSSNEVVDVMRAFPEADFRYLFFEQNPITVSIDFSNEITWPYQLQGRQDAQDALAAKELGVDGFQLLKEWNEKQTELMSDYGSFSAFFKARMEQTLGRNN